MTIRKKTKTARVKVPSEALECVRLVDYLKSKNIKHSHIANEATSRTQRIKNARLGTVAGVPDFLILLPGGVLWLEMKRQKGGRVSAEQQDWIDALIKTPGQRAYIARGFEEARDIVESCLNESTNGI